MMLHLQRALSFGITLEYTSHPTNLRVRVWDRVRDRVRVRIRVRIRVRVRGQF